MMTMTIALLHPFLFLSLVSSFSAPLPKSSTRFLLRQMAVSDHSQQSDLFIEELTWAEEREMIFKPDDDWIVKEFNSGDTLAKEHHEWFSDALSPSSDESSHLFRDEEIRSDLHEWFAEKIDWLKSVEPELHQQSSRTNKNDILNDCQRELFSFQMANSVPKTAPVPPPITKGNSMGGDWFSIYIHEN